MRQTTISLLLFAVGAVHGDVAKPSISQLEWMDYEVGAMITWNLQTLCMEDSNPKRSNQRCQKVGWVPSLEATAEWDPYALDTDKWVEIALSFGAKYIILVADHMTGFTLWDTKVHNFSITHTKWRGGGGDVVKDFIASCKKYGVRAGFFYSTHYNWYLGVNEFKVGWPPLGGKNYTQQEYDSLVAQQLRELYANGAYELWFDGGVDSALTPSVPKVVEEVVPGALCHSCVPFSRNVGLRWMGNENGVMPLPSWAASNGSTNGDPNAPLFMPAACDTVLREHYWFWWNNTEDTIKSTTEMLNTYLTSVGRSSNLLLNMAPDTTGAVPAADVVAYKKFNDAVVCLFSEQTFDMNFTAAGSTYTFTTKTTANMSISVQEDQVNGQVVNEWTLSAQGTTLVSSVGIGRQRIINIHPQASATTTFTLHIGSTFGNAVPKLRRVLLHNWVGKESCDN